MLQPRIMAVAADQDLKLHLVYETGERKCFDVRPYASGAWYGELADSSYFCRVKRLPDGTGVEWPHGQDIAPHELYDLSVPE